MIIGKESEKIEFKKSTNERKEAMKSIGAILNKSSNGTIFFGVDDNGFVVGQEISDQTIKELSNLINESIEPKIIPTIKEIELDNKRVLKLDFTGHNKPYSVNGDFLIRVGSTNRKMTSDEIKRIVKNSDYSSYWECENSYKTIDDIDNEVLLDFYYNATNSNRLLMNNFDKEKLLTLLELYKDNYLNNGGYALFGKDSNIGLKLALYASEDKVNIIDLKLLNGNIYTLVNESMKFILNNIRWRADFKGSRRIDIPEIPEKAIREIVVNAFAHANYESLAEIEINIHPNIIEIFNPGSFPDDFTPLDFIERNMNSYKRNKLILDVLFRSKEVEKSGTGFQRVNKLCKENNIRRGYEKLAFGFVFKFYRNYKEYNPSLSKNENEILYLISKNNKITKKELSKALSLSERTISRNIDSLINKGNIEKKGTNKNYSFKILK